MLKPIKLIAHNFRNPNLLSLSILICTNGVGDVMRIVPFSPWIVQSMPGIPGKGLPPRREKESGMPEERVPCRKMVSSEVFGRFSSITFPSLPSIF
jgi:hypothetical protein